MDVASYNTSYDLYIVSNWSGTYFQHRRNLSDGSFYVVGHVPAPTPPDSVPAYNLGFLRKAILDALSHGTYTEEEYTLIIANLANALVMGEDSTCEYAIKLFKEGKLKRDSHD